MAAVAEVWWMRVAVTRTGSDTNAELVARTKEGDLEAFSALVSRHEGQVLRTAYRMLSNREDARDAAQEVLLRLHRHRRRLDPSRELGAWLYRVTVNVCKTMLRRRPRDVRIALDEASPCAAVVALATGPVQEHEVEAQDASRTLARVLARLPLKERTVLVLRDLEGLSSAEVASALRCTQGTVRSHLCRARARLRNLLVAADGGRP